MKKDKRAVFRYTKSCPRDARNELYPLPWGCLSFNYSQADSGCPAGKTLMGRTGKHGNGLPEDSRGSVVGGLQERGRQASVRKALDRADPALRQEMVGLTSRGPFQHCFLLSPLTTPPALTLDMLLLEPSFQQRERGHRKLIF